MSILVATDFSPCSRVAVRLATALARRRGVALWLVHIVEHPSVDVPPTAVGPTGWEQDLLTAAEVALASEASAIREGGVAVQTRVLLGSAASGILELAAGPGIDLVVMGTHGRRGTAHLFLGSVAETVVRSATCPVLVTSSEPEDLGRWEGRKPLRLAVAADGSHAAEAALSWVGTFAQSPACELSVVRVYWPPEEALRYGLDDPWGGPRRDPELLPLLQRDLRRDAQTLIGHVPAQLRYRAAARDAAEVLAEETAALEADALVIGVPRHRPARWTVVAPGAALRSSSRPVLCVPETAVPAPRQVPQLRSILVATDLSDVSNTAIPSAYALLRAGGGRVDLCTVYVAPVADPSADLVLTKPLGDDERAKVEARLGALIPTDARSLGVTTRVSVVEGRAVAEAILAAAERWDSDVIVLGSHGRSGVKRALLGSVAEQVARQSSRPVLIVHAR
jgi:nucleotide-binding universal stress UspA family protein